MAGSSVLRPILLAALLVVLQVSVATVRGAATVKPRLFFGPLLAVSEHVNMFSHF